ncbi:MoaD/ThiS family protein [Flavobacterium paronense]|uniref:MoaD/ThiS family protein n=1 Tax=Flavobacterium paronense TaxID=1392775 RepID=A0ABV5GB03_9FLAO|nr:MoaD/ThiS family protein [Flavobacterium paronense]MDN3676777.1 MoaD/ThiS family protein [Flavobacterium paronense]
MEITLKYFGIIADITQKTEESLFIDDTSNTLKRLQSKIEIIYPKILVINYSIAVNKKFLQNDILLKNQDIVAFLPPFAGG